VKALKEIGKLLVYTGKCGKNSGDCNMKI